MLLVVGKSLFMLTSMGCMLVAAYIAYKWGGVLLTSIEMVMTVTIVVAGTLLTRFGAFLIFPPGKRHQTLYSILVKRYLPL